MQFHKVERRRHSSGHHHVASRDDALMKLSIIKVTHRNVWRTNKKLNRFPYHSRLKCKYTMQYRYTQPQSHGGKLNLPVFLSRFESPYRSTCNIPNSLSIKKYPNFGNAPDSPRSTRSAPWSRSQQKGLFGVNSSPRSVRSAASRKSTNVPTHRLRSSSVESHSSNESKAYRRYVSQNPSFRFSFSQAHPSFYRQRHRNRRTSDNESELSRGSGRSQHRKHRRHRSRHRRNESGSDNEGNRTRSFSGHRKSTGSMELLDSNNQWNDAQRLQNDSYGGMQPALSMKSNLSGSKHHSNDTDSHSHHSSSHRSRRHRKNRFALQWCRGLNRKFIRNFLILFHTVLRHDHRRKVVPAFGPANWQNIYNSI